MTEMAQHLNSLNKILSNWREGLVNEHTAWKQLQAHMFMANTDAFNQYYREPINRGPVELEKSLHDMEKAAFHGTDEDDIWAKFEALTGMSPDDMPDSLPIEDFYDPDTDEFDLDGISAW